MIRPLQLNHKIQLQHSLLNLIHKQL